MDPVVCDTCPQCGASVDLPDHAAAAVCGSCGSMLTREISRPVGGGQPDRAVLRSVQCPQCAGPLSVQGGRRILVCGHCGVRVAARRQNGFSRWFFPVRLDRLSAVGAGAVWLERYPGVSKKARYAHFTEAKLAWVPIWEYKALVAGWEFGSKLRTRYQLLDEHDGDERLDLRVVQEAVEEPHLQERRLFQAASDLAALGATRPHITGREPVLPLLAGELSSSALVLRAEGAAAEIQEKGRESVVQPLSGALSPDMHMFVLRESVTLLFYPLWFLRFAQGDRTYGVVVDGRDGTVNSATAPADTAGQKTRLLVRVGLMLAAVAVLAWLASVWGIVRGPAAAAAVIVSAAAILVVWRFRAQREVEYHEPFSG